MVRSCWWITRPKRKLILIPDILKIFSTVTEGQKWTGNRSIQLEFEEQLKFSEWKAQNTSKDGSGGRTYAVMLYMLGLWFEDKQGVQITNAGKELIRDNPPVPILTKQLINFQYPSAYSLKSKVNVSTEFHIHPHRFILRLFAEKNLEELSQDEIAFCLAPYAKSDNDINKCYQLIQDFRHSPEDLRSRAIKDSGTTESNLKDIGNTFVNQIEYTGYFIERTDLKSLRIKEGMKEILIKTLHDARESFIQDYSNPATYQIRYGAGLKTTKDYRYTSPQQPAVNPNDKVILLAYYDIVNNEPVTGISTELIQRISLLKGVSTEQTKRVLNKFAQQPLLDRFEEKYLKLSIGGQATADDFEIKTAGIFSENGFGFDSVHVGNSPRYPDLFIYFDKINKRHGLIDTKAYKEYTLPLDHKNIMAHTYIPNFRKIEYDGEEYTLYFFNYVSGGFGSSIAKSFKELVGKMTDISGSYITASNLLKLLRMHQRRKFSAEEFGSIFSCNGEIVTEVIRAGRY